MRGFYFYFMFVLSGCQTLWPATKTQTPVSQLWNGKIYIGDSRRFGVAQNSKAPVVGCAEPQFDRMICLTVEDYTALMQYFLQAACVNQ